MKIRNVLAIVSAMVLIVTQSASAAATTYYWDSDGSTAGFGTTTGTWGTDAFWNTNAVGGAGTFVTTLNAGAGDVANFGTASLGLAAGTISVGTVSSFSMFFGSASGAIVLSGGQISFGACTITVNNITDTINSTLAGSGTLRIAGSGTLVLGGANTRTGKLTIGRSAVASGTLSVSTIGNYGVAGGLGQQASGTVDQLGEGTYTGTLIYTGTGETTDRQFLIGDSTAAGASSKAKAPAPGFWISRLPLLTRPSPVSPPPGH
jgi:fibronectin-binding autotransporter adhesin